MREAIENTPEEISRAREHDFDILGHRNPWPRDPPHLPRVLRGYVDDMHCVGMAITTAFAMDLGLHPLFFDRHFDKSFW